MVHFYKFNEKWRGYFEKEKAILSDALKDQKISKIEHIGATSVVLCDTSGTIDLLLSISSALDLITIKNLLVRRGYEFVENKSNSRCLMFIRRNENKEIVATVRLVEFASKEYNTLKLFKFYLKEKEAHVFKYNQLRYTLASKYRNDNQAYEDAKEAYITSILEEHCKI